MSSGPRCCGNVEPREFAIAIVPEGTSGLLWRWTCPSCGKHRYQPFAYPADFPKD